MLMFCCTLPKVACRALSGAPKCSQATGEHPENSKAQHLAFLSRIKLVCTSYGQKIDLSKVWASDSGCCGS